jgi:hypothetical protein
VSDLENHETRQERRARKLKAKRERMQQHGAGLRRGFADAALKMARKHVRRQARRGR